MLRRTRLFKCSAQRIFPVANKAPAYEATSFSNRLHQPINSTADISETTAESIYASENLFGTSAIGAMGSSIGYFCFFLTWGYHIGKPVVDAYAGAEEGDGGDDEDGGGDDDDDEDED